VEQVKLVLPAGDVVAAGTMQVAFVGGSDAVRVRYWSEDSGDVLSAAPRRIMPYEQFFHPEAGQRLFNLAALTGLKPGRYQYEIVDDPHAGVPVGAAGASGAPGEGGSPERALVEWCNAFAAVVPGSFTFGPKGSRLRVAVMGDMGASSDGPHLGCFASRKCAGAAAVKELLRASSGVLDAVFNIGDISYAAGADAVWEDYARENEHVSSQVPWMTAVGNHEWGPDSNCECGTPYAFRYPMPTNDGAGVDFDAHRKPICHTSVHQKGKKMCSYANDDRALAWHDMAYSVDMGNARIVVVSTQHGITKGTGQFEWLRRKLTTDPKRWQVIMGHIDACSPCDPLQTAENDMADCYCWPNGGPVGEYGASSMSVVQQLVTQHGLPVDLVLAGHSHEYFVRNCTGMPDCDAGKQAPLVIVGGAGYGHDEGEPGDARKERGNQCSRAPYGYVELGFGDDAIEVNFRGVAGTGSDDYDTASCLTLHVKEKHAEEKPAGWWPRFTQSTGGRRLDDDSCHLNMHAVFDTDRCTPASFSVHKGEKPPVRLI